MENQTYSTSTRRVKILPSKRGCLNTRIEDYNNLMMTESEINQKIKIIETDLDIINIKVFKDTSEGVRVFGSSVNGFYGKTSDVDTMIRMKRDGTEHAFWKLVNHQKEHYSGFKLLNHINKARVPLITLQHIKTKI